MAQPDPTLLDATGCLAAGARVMAPSSGYLVFGQQAPAPFDLAVLRGYAARFLDAKVGLSADKVGPAPAHDLAFVMVHHGGRSAQVAVECRGATATDRALAWRAERDSGTAGLACLAERCPRVFVLHAERPEEPACLLVACLLAGTSLGPAVDLDGTSIFGVKSGRERLARALTRG